MRISCCLASSRENTMIFFGVPSSPLSTRRTNVLPMEPVPPVTRTLLPSNMVISRRRISRRASRTRALQRADQQHRQPDLEKENRAQIEERGLAQHIGERRAGEGAQKRIAGPPADPFLRGEQERAEERHAHADHDERA